MFQFDEGPSRQGHKVMLATTAYDAPAASYTFAIHKSREALKDAGIQSGYYLLTGNCHVDDARNQAVQAFLGSDCDDLVFLDADVSWYSSDLVKLCKRDVDLVGGVYPYRREDKAGEIPCRLITGKQIIDGLVEVEGLPTGFMRIRRRVFEALKDSVPSFEHEGTMWLFFERTLESGTRWGGDLNFCNRWRATGGKVYAEYETVLGHAFKGEIHGSLGSQLRRIQGTTLRHVVDKIRANESTTQDLTEVREFMDNRWAAPMEALAVCTAYARKADGPILEAGSGLSTILMAAATKETVYCLEHSAIHIAKLKQMVHDAGVQNIGLCVVPVTAGWYDVKSFKGLPDEFAFGLNDGPPRQIGSRDGYFREFGERVKTFVCDDMNDPNYKQYVEGWAAERSRPIQYVSNRVAVIQ